MTQEEGVIAIETGLDASDIVGAAASFGVRITTSLLRSTGAAEAVIRDVTARLPDSSGFCWGYAGDAPDLQPVLTRGGMDVVAYRMILMKGPWRTVGRGCSVR